MARRRRDQLQQGENKAESTETSTVEVSAGEVDDTFVANISAEVPVPEEEIVCEVVHATQEEVSQALDVVMEKHADTMEQLKAEENPVMTDEQVNKLMEENADLMDSLAGVVPVTVVDVPVEPPKPEVVCIEDAARRLIFDLRDGWLASIRVRASLMGLNPHKFHTLDEWKEVFIAWGGHGILK